MFDINIKKLKKGRVSSYTFLYIGIVFLIVMSGILIFNIMKYNRLDSKVLSLSVSVNSYANSDGKTMYSTVYYYKV